MIDNYRNEFLDDPLEHLRELYCPLLSCSRLMHPVRRLLQLSGKSGIGITLQAVFSKAVRKGKRGFMLLRDVRTWKTTRKIRNAVEKQMKV